MALTLDDINTDAGCLQYLFLAETMTPGYASYSAPEAERGFKAMKAVVYNRLARKREFGAPQGTNIRDIVIVQHQFPEFIRTATGIDVTPPTKKNIQDALNIANNRADRRHVAYETHINAAKRISLMTEIIDEFKDINLIGQTAVDGKVYGFNKGAGGVMGRMIKIPNGTVDSRGISHNGIILENQFYTLKSGTVFMLDEKTGEIIEYHLT